MVREKTRLELVEELSSGAAGMAERLRGALFAISLEDDIEEAKRIARAALSGELHGREPKVQAVNMYDRS